jgi:hypothetical protein
MKPLTKKQQQWAWFIGLWCGGLAAVLILAHPNLAGNKPAEYSIRSDRKGR